MSASDADADQPVVIDGRINGRFAPGFSGNPGGKPVGTRNGLVANFLDKLKKDFDAHGEQAIVEMREQKPAEYIKAIASLVPKDVHVSAQPLHAMTDDELYAAVASIQRYLDSGAAASGDREAIEGEASRVLPALPEAAGVPRSGEDAS